LRGRSFGRIDDLLTGDFSCSFLGKKSRAKKGDAGTSHGAKLVTHHSGAPFRGKYCKMTVLRIAMVCGLALASFSARADGKSELQAAPTVQIDRTVVDATGKIVGYLIAGPPSDYSNNPSLIVVHGTGANAAASASARISAPGFTLREASPARLQLEGAVSAFGALHVRRGAR
jgi:hypothetical protein